MDQPPHADVGDLPSAPPTSLTNRALHPPAHLPSPAHVANHTHVAAYEPHFVTIWTTQRLRRLKTSCKEIARSLIGRFRGLSRQERNSKDMAIRNIVLPNTVINEPSADCDAFQNDTVRHSATHGDAILSDTSQHRAAPSRTWDVLISIIPHSDSKSDLARNAICTFDSGCAHDLMSSSYAAKTLGIIFDNPIRNAIAVTLTGETVYSIGVVVARWIPLQGATLSLPTGDTITLSAKTHYTTFHVVVSDLWDVFIGFPSLRKNGYLGNNLPLANPLRYYVSPAGPTPVTTPAQDEDYLRRIEEEQKKVEAARQRRAAAQQTQGT